MQHEPKFSTSLIDTLYMIPYFYFLIYGKENISICRTDVNVCIDMINDRNGK